MGENNGLGRHQPWSLYRGFYEHNARRSTGSHGPDRYGPDLFTALAAVSTCSALAGLVYGNLAEHDGDNLGSPEAIRFARKVGFRNCDLELLKLGISSSSFSIHLLTIPRNPNLRRRSPE
jgi:hypothetical protein